MKVDLTILIPAYKEEKRIGKTLTELAKFIKSDKFLNQKDIEVMVAAAKSPDKTEEVAKSKAQLFKRFKFVDAGRPGKGRNVKTGMLAASGQAVIFMDADLATPLKYITKAYKLFLDGNDVVIGTRNLRKHHPGFSRRLLSNLGNILYRIVGGVWIEDSQCGFKLFSAEAAKICFNKMTIMGWSFDMEVLTIAKVNNFKIKSFRVNDWVSVAGGTFETNALKSAIESLVELAKIYKNRILGKYR